VIAYDEVDDRYTMADLMLDTFMPRTAPAAFRDRPGTATSNALTALREAVDDAFRCHRSDPAQMPTSPLTPREAEVLCEVAEGRTTGEIAIALDVTRGTVCSLRFRVFKKIAEFCGEKKVGAVDAVLIALAAGWI
jgi:DNA-binding CsgD family transcriptional regulator